MPEHLVNWFEHSERSLVCQFPWMRPFSTKVVDRLANLLLEGLPDPIRSPLIELLPENLIKAHFASFKDPFRESKRLTEYKKIFYLDFVKTTASLLEDSGLRDLTLDLTMDLSDDLATFFLWSVAQGFPAETKTRMVEILPIDLRSRIDLYCAQMDEAKVA